MAIYTNNVCSLLPISLRTHRIEIPDLDAMLRIGGIDQIVAASDDLLLLHKLELRFRHILTATAWDLHSAEPHGRKCLATFKRWKASPIKILATFGDAFSRERGPVVPQKPSEMYVEEDIVAALEHCRVIARQVLDKTPYVISSVENGASILEQLSFYNYEDQ
jgi:hypothetical protein